MTVVNLTFEEFADRIEDVLDLVDKGDKVFIHHEGKIYTVIPVAFRSSFMVVHLRFDRDRGRGCEL